MKDLLTVETGLDIVRREGLTVPGRGRIGLLCNNASVDRLYTGAPEILATTPGVQLVRIFSPQHGFAGEKQDNMVESGDGVHPATRVPLFSLYGRVREPEPEMLEGLDALVIDIPDVGTRVYTFLSTALLCMKVCAQVKVPVIVLDRPNPIGGEAVEGPVLRAGFSSFVGLIPVPLRHGLTAGEYCRLGRSLLGLDLPIEVVEARGWKRDAYLDETALPWVMPSPNLPVLEGAIVYPGMVMLEGTNLSEGRGTTRPFELWGAPWLDTYPVLAEISRMTRAGTAGPDTASGGKAREPRRAGWLSRIAGEIADASRQGAGTGPEGVASRPPAVAPAAPEDMAPYETGPGFLLRPVAFQPTFHKFAGETVRGFQIHVTDRARFRPVFTATAILAAVIRIHRDRFAWKQPPYEYETDRMPIDLIAGTDAFRTALESGAEPADIAAGWRTEEDAFRRIRHRVLLSY